MDERSFYVYILTNFTHSVLYTGMTNDLLRRMYEHKNELVNGFSKRYHVNKLVYFEAGPSVTGAIYREKQIKRLLRAQKEALIREKNPEWRDLYDDLF